jgi:vacuolar-type H+-ATPase subunit B/Vma2
VPDLRLFDCFAHFSILSVYITEDQIVLSADLHARGIYPPVDALSSLSRLMRHGAGPGRTRDDHLDVAAQTLAALAAARRARELAELIGTAALSTSDRRYQDFETAFERRLMHQCRTITAPAAWDSPALTATRQAHRAALAAAVRHAAAAEAVRVIEAEALATQYRLRAVRDRWIPRLEQALTDVTFAIEELERADAARLHLAAKSAVLPAG